MNYTRRFILGHVAAIPAVALATDADGTPRHDIHPLREAPGPSASHFPNVPVVASTGKEYLWYDDVVRGARVAINFFSFENDEKHAVTDHLLRAHRLAAAEGIDGVTMISVAIDAAPLNMLAKYVSSKNIDDRWLFLTGTPANIELIRSFLFVRDTRSHRTPVHGHGQSHTLTVARYGNESLARWASYPLRCSPESIVRRYAWI